MGGSKGFLSRFEPIPMRVMLLLSVGPLLAYLVYDTLLLQMPAEGVTVDSWLDFLFEEPYGYGVLVLMIVVWAFIPGIVAFWFLFAPKAVHVEGGRLVTVRNGRRKEYEIGRLKDVRVDMHEGSCHFFRLQPSAGKPVVVEPIGDAAGAVEELEAQCRQRGVPFHRKEHTLHPRGVISYGLLPLAFNIVAIVLFRVFVPGGFGSWMG